MNRNGAVRRAFTIVELLVVIAIIGVLIGLLLPAVNMARESGRRIACANNLKQLGLAMSQYEELNKIFPINWGTLVDTSGNSITGRNSLGHSWLTCLLPFLEEKQIYDLIKFGQPLSANYQAAQQPVVEFSCPSDPGERVSTNMEPMLTEDAANSQPTDDPMIKQLGVTNYKACAGMNWAKSVYPRGILGNGRVDTRIYAKQGRNSGDPSVPAPGQPLTYEFDHGNGITCRGCLKFNDTSVSPAVLRTSPLYTTADRDIKDGRSKTFAIGESVPSWCPYSAWYSYEGATATCGIPLNYIAAPVDRGDIDSTKPYYNDYYSRSFGSYHPGGANFCMCDGSVMFIKDDIMLQQKDTEFGYMMADPTNGYLIIPPTATGPDAKYLPGAYMNMATIDGGELVQPQK